MEDGNIENDVEMNYHSEASIGEKRKREGKLRSKVWEHFTKIIKPDGTTDKCQCNYCHKLFSCTSKSGTTHLLRHVTDGICPVLNKNKSVTVSSYVQRSSMMPTTGAVPWSFDREPPVVIEECYRIENSRGKLPQSSRPKGEAWMNEFRSCVAKLVKLTDGKINDVVSHDYSIGAAVKCLNELEDIPQSSEMYVDAFEILQDEGERECFICLPPEPRRRWLQRVLHRNHPLNYGSNL